MAQDLAETRFGDIYRMISNARKEGQTSVTIPIIVKRKDWVSDPKMYLDAIMNQYVRVLNHPGYSKVLREDDNKITIVF